MFHTHTHTDSDSLLAVKTWTIVRTVRYVLTAGGFVGQCLLVVATCLSVQEGRISYSMCTETSVPNYEITRFRNSCICVVRNIVISK